MKPYDPLTAATIPKFLRKYQTIIYGKKLYIPIKIRTVPFSRFSMILSIHNLMLIARSFRDLLSIALL